MRIRKLGKYLASLLLLQLKKKGRVTSEELDMFSSAGYSKEHVMELIVGVTHKTMSNYINHIAENTL